MCSEFKLLQCKKKEEDSEMAYGEVVVDEKEWISGSYVATASETKTVPNNDKQCSYSQKSD
jgi:hypothetical protein